jgi:hypothetical protein
MTYLISVQQYLDEAEAHRDVLMLAGMGWGLAERVEYMRWVVNDDRVGVQHELFRVARIDRAVVRVDDQAPAYDTVVAMAIWLDPTHVYTEVGPAATRTSFGFKAVLEYAATPPRGVVKSPWHVDVPDTERAQWLQLMHLDDDAERWLASR